MINRDAAIEAWFQAHDAYHKACHAYNERRRLLEAERERGNWSMNMDQEYKAHHEAQRYALQADNKLYEALCAVNVSFGTGD